MTKERILVTGASSGIGLELARVAAAAGHELILVARSEAKLAELAQELAKTHGTVCSIIPMDLAELGAAERLERILRERELQVDGLINNAGFGLHGLFTENDPAEQLSMIQLNVTVLTDLTQRLLPGMLSRGRGRILNVASVAAFSPGPYMAVYHATKAFVLSLSEALAFELRGTGVTVTALCPGPVVTGFQARSRMGLNMGHRMLLTRADEVAEAGYRAMMKGQPIVMPGLMNRLLTLSTRFATRAAVTKMVGRVSQTRGS